MYDVSLIFGYYEFEVDPDQTGEPEIPNTRVYKELVWQPVKNQIAPGTIESFTPFSDGNSFLRFRNGDGSVGQELNGENFYSFIAGNLSDVTNTNIRRCAALTIDLRVDAAGPELAEYIQARNSNQNLIGGLFPADPFSNIQDGFGIFSFKTYSTKKDLPLDDDTFEYLKFGEITNQLGFREFGCN